MMQNRFKKIISIILLCSMAFVMLSGFSDLPKSFWGYSDVMESYNAGILLGYGEGEDGRIGPEDPTTKEQMVIMLYRVLEKSGKLQSELDFTDKYRAVMESCKISEWAYKEVSYALEYGIVKAEDFALISDLGGWATIDRIMLARWLLNAAGYNIGAVRVNEFNDTADMVEYYGIFDVLYRYGLIQGDENTNFMPDRVTSRAEAATICTRLLKRKTEVGSDLSKDLVILYGTAKNFNANYCTFTMNVDGTEKKIQLSNTAKIILNGETSSFGELAKLSGSKITISTVAGEDDLVLAHSNALSFVGKEGSVVGYEKRAAYTLVHIDINGNVIPFCVTSNTTIIGGSLTLGSRVNIFCDGCELLEVKLIY